MKPSPDPPARLSAPEAYTKAVLFGILLLLAAGGLTGGWLYYRSYERQFRVQVGQQLKSIAAFKVAELELYRNERLADAALCDHNTAFARLVSRFLGPAGDPEARRDLQAWLARFESHYQYDRAFLCDAQGVPRLAASESTAQVSALGAARAAQCLRSGQVAVLDFFRHEQDHRVYLDVLTPIFDEADGRRPLGVLVMRIDPDSYLYPFIQRWPVPSATAEILLVRRDANEVVYLNDLRFNPNAALNLRFPLSATDVPAVAAVLGRQGTMEGRDYRGQPVLAALQAIPDSPWFMVTKIDRAEAFAPLRAEFWQVVVITGLLLCGAGTVTGLFWWQQRFRFYKQWAMAAEALRVSEERHRLLIETLPSILVVHAGDSTVLYANAMAATSLGLSAEQLRGRVANDPVWRFLREDGTPLPGAEFPINQVLASGEELTNFVMGILRPGETEPVWTHISAYPRRDASGNIDQVVIHGVDITTRKRAEELLQRTLADLTRSNQELEQFAYVASHDLQEPLRMVASYVQLLAQRYEGQLDDKADKYIHYAVDGAARMQTLIDDLLAYSRVALHGQPLEPAAAQAAVDEALKNLSALIRENHARITCDALPSVRADTAQLVLVFQNLIANAVKFRREDPPCVHISARDRQSEWLFAVQDNGIGIEPQHAERVFQIFQRLHTRTEYPGTGIGLAVCQRIVTRYGGTIWFESTPGQDSTFFFTLPK